MSYADEVRAIVDGFDYELCAECGNDLDGHAIEPDVLGHAGARCLDDHECEYVNGRSETHTLCSICGSCDGG